MGRSLATNHHIPAIRAPRYRARVIASASNRPQLSTIANLPNDIMRTHTAFQVEAGLAGLLTTATALAATPLGPTPEHQSPEVTLRFTVTVGMRDSGLTRFGLGLGQIQAAGNLWSPGGNPMHRREIMQFEFSPRRADPVPVMRVMLGGRMTYDFNHGVFGWRNGRSPPDSALIVFDTPVQRPVTGVGRGLAGCGCLNTKPIALQLPEDLSIGLTHARNRLANTP